MNRAYSTLEIKAATDSGGKRRFSGIATTPSTDRMADIVEPKGAQFKLPLPLLWQHNSAQPIGWVQAAKVTANGIEIEGEVASIDEDGSLKQRLTEAWQMITSKLVRGLSIGFNAIEHAQIDGTYGIRFTKWEWLELSAVTIPANQDASIVAIKSIDRRQRAALGTSPPPQSSKPPGASGTTQTPAAGGFFNSRSQKGTDMKTIQELRAEREEKAARMGELIELRSAEDREFTEAERVEFDACTGDVQKADDQIRELNFHALKSATAKGVDGTSQRAASESRSRAHITTKSNLPKGTIFVRYAIAMANGRGSLSDAMKFAERWDRDTPEVGRFIKAVAGSTQTGGENWGSQLVAEPMREFLELLMPETIIGKVSNFRRVPFNTKIIEQTDGATVNWVGESAVKPAGENDFDTFSLLINKIAGIVAFSDELARLSSPSAEATISADMRKQIVKFMDEQFIDPSVTASAGVRPASVTNTASPTSSTGTDADAFRADMRSMRAAMRAANLSSMGTVIVMPGGQADALADMQNALGQPEFPTISSAGGTYRGSQVIVSESVPVDSTGSIIVLMKPSEILMADDGVTLVDVNRDGAVNLGAGLISLWQQNLTAVRVERWVTWLKARSAAVQYISGANYDPDGS